MKEIKSIEEIIYDYDNFIIDQWGVMHDGTYGYDHALNSINFLNNNIKIFWSVKLVFSLDYNTYHFLIK